MSWNSLLQRINHAINSIIDCCHNPLHSYSYNWFFSLIFVLCLLVPGWRPQEKLSTYEDELSIRKRGIFSAQNDTNFSVYLPVLLKAKPYTPLRRVNLPFFEDKVSFEQTAIFWFGQVTLSENYADVRAGYTQDELYIHVAVFDRNLWYDKTPSADTISEWDALSIYLDTDPLNGNNLDEDNFKFDGQLNWSEPGISFQHAYQGGSSGWEEVPIPFEADAGWRGGALNDDAINDRGWRMTYHFPFSSLGFVDTPGKGETWNLAIVLHDRDDPEASPNIKKYWPETVNLSKPATWGELVFGLPEYDPPETEPLGTATIRHGLNGASVMDGEVGGGTNCGKGLSWETFGTTVTPGSEENDKFNIQNQYDVSDWPCFSKYYVTFPLDGLPADKAIISASLTLFQFGNSGGGEYGEAPISFIQVLTIQEPWDESTLSWNEAPLVAENITGNWVEPIVDFPGWPGEPRTWDVSYPLAQAYAQGIDLRLALYSADAPPHTGKYFTSSDTGEWNKEGRPTLTVIWGND